MAASIQSTITLVSLILFQYLSGSYSMTFTVVNNCNHIVWSGILSEAGTTLFSTTGFTLRPESNALVVPPKWSDRLWGRTLCSRNSAGKFSCVTGDYASSTIECTGRNAQSPATLAEFTLNGAGRLTFFDVHLVNGCNLSSMIEPHGAISGGNCMETSCMMDLNATCPSESKVTSNCSGVACRSAREAFWDPEYCCSGAYASPDTCKPSSYTQFYESVCPHPYSYSITFTCPTSLIESRNEIYPLLEVMNVMTVVILSFVLVVNLVGYIWPLHILNNYSVFH